MTGSRNRLRGQPHGPRPLERLTGVDLFALELGMHADGAGLYLRVEWDGARRWSFIYHRERRRREMSLGPLRDVELEEARAQACRFRCTVRAGGDPIGRRRAAACDSPASARQRALSGLAAAAVPGRGADIVTGSTTARLCWTGFPSRNVRFMHPCTIWVRMQGRSECELTCGTVRACYAF